MRWSKLLQFTVVAALLAGCGMPDGEAISLLTEAILAADTEDPPTADQAECVATEVVAQLGTGPTDILARAFELDDYEQEPLTEDQATVIGPIIFDCLEIREQLLAEVVADPGDLERLTNCIDVSINYDDFKRAFALDLQGMTEDAERLAEEVEQDLADTTQACVVAALKDSEYGEQLVDAFLAGNVSGDTTREQAECMAFGVLDLFGPERIESFSAGEGAVTEAEARVLADLTFDCVDIRRQFLDGARSEGAPEVFVSCVNGQMDFEVLREAFFLGFQGREAEANAKVAEFEAAASQAAEACAR